MVVIVAFIHQAAIAFVDSTVSANTPGTVFDAVVDNSVGRRRRGGINGGDTTAVVNRVKTRMAKKRVKQFGRTGTTNTWLRHLKSIAAELCLMCMLTCGK